MPDDARQLVRQSFLQHLYGIDLERQKRYAEYREYYDGEHATQLTRRIRKFLEIKTGESFRCNYCPTVVDALAERLHVTGFDAGEQQTEIMWAWWEANRMDSVQGSVHTASIRDGDAFVIVEWNDDSDQPRFSLELAYDGGNGVKMHYSDERRDIKLFASKRWEISNPVKDAGKLRRINLYYPDRIEKYISDSDQNMGDWREYYEDDSSEWPIPWTRSNGEPLGVPVIHFAYKAGGYNFGKSRLRDVIPLQNKLNKEIIDITASTDTDAFPMLWGTGDDFGSINIGPGVFIQSDNADAKVGRIPSGNMKSLLEVKNDSIMDIARISNTPLSRFQLTGHIASEGTLKQQESGLVADAVTTQINLGNAWEDVMVMARVLSNEFGSVTMDEEQTISTEWTPAVVRDETELITRLAMMSEKLHVPDAVLWRMAGLTDDQIEQAEGDPQYQSFRAMQGAGMLLNEENRGG